MLSKEIEKYIGKRYERWLDYARYHCGLCGIVDESEDVLNEVVLSLLKKSETKLEVLFASKKGQYTELDFYVLRMIKLNASSPTSPYQSKYKAIPVDVNVDYSRLEIEDCCEEQTDRSGYVLEKMHELRTIILELGFSEKAMALFEFRFFQDGAFKDWDGDESIKELYDQYSKIMDVVKRKIKGELIL